MLHEVVTEADIADIISKWTGIPVSKLLASEREKLLHLADELHRRVIGQDEAVEAVADAIMRWVAVCSGWHKACENQNKLGSADGVLRRAAFLPALWGAQRYSSRAITCAHMAKTGRRGVKLCYGTSPFRARKK
jgi:hypothetical protein